MELNQFNVLPPKAGEKTNCCTPYDRDKWERRAKIDDLFQLPSFFPINLQSRILVPYKSVHYAF